MRDLRGTLIDEEPRLNKDINIKDVQWSLDKLTIYVYESLSKRTAGNGDRYDNASATYDLNNIQELLDSYNLLWEKNEELQKCYNMLQEDHTWLLISLERGNKPEYKVSELEKKYDLLQKAFIYACKMIANLSYPYYRWSKEEAMEAIIRNVIKGDK